MRTDEFIHFKRASTKFIDAKSFQVSNKMIYLANYSLEMKMNSLFACFYFLHLPDFVWIKRAEIIEIVINSNVFEIKMAEKISVMYETPGIILGPKQR